MLQIIALVFFVFVGFLGARIPGAVAAYSRNFDHVVLFLKAKIVH